MKLLSVFILGICMQVSATGNAQKVNLSEKNAPLQKIFRQIHRQTGFQFFYEDALLDKAGKVTVLVQNVSIEDALNAALKNLPLKFEIVNKAIVVSAGPALSEEKPGTITTPPPPITIRGIIRSDKEELLQGISIIIKGTEKGTVSNENGIFSLEVEDPNAILVISGVGFETQEIALKGKTTLLIILATKISPLDDVQIIGYGKTTRRLKTGSVSTIKAEDIGRQPVANAVQAMQGRVAGVAITQTAGAIGSGIEIQIRGVNTIESGNQPLVVLDGAVMPDINRGLGTSIGGYMPWGSTTMNNINPADIESIEVLKDADATAIYGSRGQMV